MLLELFPAGSPQGLAPGRAASFQLHLEIACPDNGPSPLLPLLSLPPIIGSRHCPVWKRVLLINPHPSTCFHRLSFPLFSSYSPLPPFLSHFSLLLSLCCSSPRLNLSTRGYGDGQPPQSTPYNTGPQINAGEQIYIIR